MLLGNAAVILLATLTLEWKTDFFFLSSACVSLLGPAVEFLGTLLVEGCPHVGVQPDVAELGERAELGSLEFVDVVVELVGALDEVGLAAVDCDLHFDQHGTSIDQVHQDVLGALAQPVLHSHDAQHVRVEVVDPLKFSK